MCLHIPIEMTVFATARVPKPQINFLTNGFLDWLKGEMNDWSHQTLRKFVARDPVPKKKWEIIRAERMAIYLLFSQARFYRKDGNWLQLTVFKEILTFNFSAPFLNGIVFPVTNFSPAENTAASQKTCIRKLIIIIKPRGIRNVVIRLLCPFPLSNWELPEGLPHC